MASERCPICKKYLFTEHEKHNHKCHPEYYVHNLEDEQGVEEAKAWQLDDFPMLQSSKRHAISYEDAVEIYCKDMDTEYQVGFFFEPGYFAVLGPDDNNGSMKIAIIKISAEPAIEYYTEQIEMAASPEESEQEEQ